MWQRSLLQMWKLSLRSLQSCREQFLRTSHKVNAMVTNLSLFFLKCDARYSSSPCYGHPPFYDRVFHASFMPLLLFCDLQRASQDESYDLQDRKAFAKFLIDADIRLVPGKAYEVLRSCLMVCCVSETDHEVGYDWNNM